MAVAWGILSTAAINDKVVEGVRGSDRAEFVAISSRDAARAEATAARLGIERSYGSYDGVLADPEVDAVYIPLPNGQHVDWTVRALEAGKHVLVEKPFSRDAGGVAHAASVAQERGLVLSEAFMWRYNPQTERLLELIAAGTIGRIVLIRAAFSFALEEMRGADDTRFDPALEGGAMMDVGCYCLSACRLIGGEPTRVHAESTIGRSGVDVAMAVTMRLDSGILAHFDCGFITRFRAGLEVVGEDGTLLVDDPWLCRNPAITVRHDEGEERHEVAPANSFRREFDHVSDAIAGHTDLRFGHADAVLQADALAAIYRSAESGAAVSL